jgi:cell division protein FtsA
MLNLRHNYICALDIGSSKIASCAARLKGKAVSGIFFNTFPVKGIRKGNVTDSIALVGAVEKALKNLKAKSGINIKYVHANISGQDITTKHSRAIIPLAERGNKVITIFDIERVNDEARILGSSLEEEIIHQFPYSYSIDSKSSILNPLGLYSHKLEVDLYLVCAKMSSVQSLSRVIHQAGYEIRSLSFSGLATALAVFDKELKQGLNLFCDIGSDTTEILIFQDGFLKDIQILPIGGDDLTTEISAALKVPFELAEDIKRSYGIVKDTPDIGEDKEILVKKSTLYQPIKQRAVSEVTANKAKFLCQRIKEAALEGISAYAVDNFVVTGRTILLEGFIETLESVLSVPVRIGRISDTRILSLIQKETELSGQKFLTYLTSIGVLLGCLRGPSAATFTSSKTAQNPLLKAVGRFKEIYQEYF